MRRQRILGIQEQRAYIRALWQGLDCRVTSGLLVCRGKVRPLPICSDYGVRIEYRAGKNPKVWVEGLPSRQEEPPEKRIPHRYADGTICLFNGQEWTPERPIAQTIIPWLLEWLMYYEGWLATEVWQGGGTHPQPLAVHEAGPERRTQLGEEPPTGIATDPDVVSAAGAQVSEETTEVTKSSRQ